MNEENLAEAIRKQILDQGFARIEAAQVQSVFADHESALPAFALKNGFNYSHPEAGQSAEYVFYSTGNPAAAAPPSGAEATEADALATKAAFAAGRSPSEKLKDPERPPTPAPGVERTGDRPVKKEINPNTE